VSKRKILEVRDRVIADGGADAGTS
jgi:hypothetical protein